MDEQIKMLQQKLLSMLLKLDEFCGENGIEYYLIGGSALGAVRHSGFIPWDDDADVAMFREDFERFEATAEGKKISGLLYEPVHKHSFPEAPIGFLYDVSDPDIPLEECPCIDIFALDGVPDSGFLRKKQKLWSLLYHISVLRRPAQNRGGLSAFITKAFIALTPARLFDFYIKSAKKAITKYPAKSAKNVANIFGMKRYDKEIMPLEYFGAPKRTEFEGHLLPIPEQYDKYLTHLFGDYKKLPPPDKRKPHHMNLTWEDEHAADKHNNSDL